MAMFEPPPTYADPVLINSKLQPSDPGFSRFNPIWLKWFLDLTGVVNAAGGTSIGTVKSVGLAAPPEFVVTGSPVTSTGTLTLSKAPQNPNKVWAGPTSGAAAVPTFRSLVAADFPAGTGTVTTVSVVTANGVSGSVANPTTTPAITLSLGAITPTTVTASSTVQGTQLISTVATGTAPLSVTSTTNVPNLNASSLSGATFAAPGAIGGGTPAGASFTTLAVSGQQTSVGGGTFFVGSGSTTGQTNAQLGNTGGSLQWGIESSAGGTLVTGAPAYSGVMTTYTATALTLGTNSTARLTIASAGDATFSSTVKTADPGLGAGAWKLGQVESGIGLALNTTSYIQIMVDGAAVKLAQVL